MLNKQQIIEEIKRTAKENGGKPLGATNFEKETGIRPYDWYKYWTRFSNALKEAGFAPNRGALEILYSHDFLIEKVIEIMRKLKKFPTYHELFFEKNQNKDFPFRSIIKRLGLKQERIKSIIEYSKTKDYKDIIELCEPLLEEDKQNFLADASTQNLGEVYLFKSGKYYKIGKTNDTVRRGSELKIQLPENLDLIHSIKTDDPSGVETYWHKRFEDKRMNGEWFDLNSSDIKSFKRWRKIY